MTCQITHLIRKNLLSGIVLNLVTIEDKKDDRNYFEGIETFLSPLYKGLTLAESPGLVSKAYRLASEGSKALKYIGEFTGVATVVIDGAAAYNDYRDGQFVSGTTNLLKATGQGVILWGGGEEMELLWNTSILTIDGISTLLKNR